MYAHCRRRCAESLGAKLAEEISFEKGEMDPYAEPEFLRNFKDEGVWKVRLPSQDSSAGTEGLRGRIRRSRTRTGRTRSSSLARSEARSASFLALLLLPMSMPTNLNVVASA